MLLAGICFTAPDDGEWKVIPGSAKAGGIEIMADTLAIGGVVPATAERPGRICGQLGYDITGLELEWDKSINLTVRSLFAQPGERNPCSDIQHRFETNSQAQSMGIRLSSPVLTFFSFSPVTFSSPTTSVTTEFQQNLIFGLANARSWTILSARRASRR